MGPPIKRRSGRSKRQLESKFYQFGSPAKASLIASIYFPFDNARLDSQDKKVLDTLAATYLLYLSQRHITFTFEGHADWRGADKYNKRLSANRIAAVKSYLNGVFSKLPTYHSITKPLGEKHASRDDPDRDRRVDVLSSYVPTRIIRVPPMHIEGKLPKGQMRRVPVKFIRKTFITENPDMKAISHVIIYEKYEEVPKDYGVTGVYVGEKLASWEIFLIFSKSSIEVRRGTIKYGPKSGGYYAKEAVKLIGGWGRLKKGEVEDTLEEWESWDKYPKKKGDFLEKFRP